VPTSNQDVGQRGEKAVCSHVACPRCGRAKQFRALPANFECVDVICKFCGFLAQVKATNGSTAEGAPSTVLGAAWRPQHERIIGGIFHALYVVTFEKRSLIRIDYVPAHMLGAFPGVFKPRKKLSESARRAGWQGFVYDLRELPPVAMQQVYPADASGAS
jgi:Dam-replacing family